MIDVLKIGDTTIELGEERDFWVVSSPDSPTKFYERFADALARAIIEEIPTCVKGSDAELWEEQVSATVRLLRG